MIFLDDYNKYKYTKIRVPINLGICPSDDSDAKHMFDIDCNELKQKNCYLGESFVDEMYIRKMSMNENDYVAKWMFEIILSGGKNETEVIKFLNELCMKLSLNCVKQRNFQYHGMGTFSYHPIDVKRTYAWEDKNFIDVDCSMRIFVETKTRHLLKSSAFELPKVKKTESEFVEKLEKAFVRGIESKDIVTRYILLYYLFEIMYSSNEYKNTRPDIKKRGENRNLILCEYLRQQFHFDKYHSWGTEIELDSNILNEIINTRNDLVHRADESKVSHMMYRHMIPILKKVLDSF